VAASGGGSGFASGRLSLGVDGYEALTVRLLEGREVGAGDADLVVGRVGKVLAQVGGRADVFSLLGEGSRGLVGRLVG